MRTTYAHWLKTAVHPEGLRAKAAVNAQADREKLPDFDDVLVLGTQRRGAPYAVFSLGQALEAEKDDILVLVSDDTFSPQGWDQWLIDQFKGHDDAIIIYDGGQDGPCVTQPIMTFGCLLKLNRILNHPSYVHFCADAELYRNLSDLGLVRDLRNDRAHLFEHRSWAWGKRARDEHDEYNISMWPGDTETMHARLRLPVVERLVLGPEFLVNPSEVTQPT